MKSILNKLKKTNSSSKQQLVEIDSNAKLFELLHKALVGFLAKEMGEEMNLSTDASHVLFYTAISSTEQFSKNDGLFFHYTFKLLEWCENEQDISQEIDQLDASEQMKRAITNVYQKHQQDIERLINLSKPKAPAISQKEWEIYRDAMYASSQEKFLLIDRYKLDENYNGSILTGHTILERHDIPICRQKMMNTFEQLGVSTTKLKSWLLVVSEAVTNVIKHAHSGSMMVIKEEQEVRVIIKDNGNGFPIRDLPNLVLLSGYSSKQSLGQGFTLMLKIVDQIRLYTDLNGSSMVLVMKL
ncbi:ATP-binding protein [Alkalibacillus aidingensis]|uniref:ATP-binding protein n=1 Tax=Alkalibacillus aidingensis TaxID=2747607 RepID=UPI00166008C6|nr:ATP-binding protein [Alkalibacillus aidingensis]